MKALCYPLIVFLVICSLPSVANRLGDHNPIWALKLKAPQVEKQANRNIWFSHVAPLQARTPSDDFNKYRRQQWLGFAMVPVGAGAIAGGSYMIYKGAAHLMEKKKPRKYLPGKSREK